MKTRYRAFLVCIHLCTVIYGQDAPDHRQVVFFNDSNCKILPNLVITGTHRIQAPYFHVLKGTISIDSINCREYGWYRDSSFTFFSPCRQHIMDDELKITATYRGRKMTVHMFGRNPYDFWGFPPVNIPFKEGSFFVLEMPGKSRLIAVPPHFNAIAPATRFRKIDYTDTAYYIPGIEGLQSLAAYLLRAETYHGFIFKDRVPCGLVYINRPGKVNRYIAFDQRFVMIIKKAFSK